jgi:hypothetical protein
VDLLMIDVQLTPADGKPASMLTAADFQVKIGGRKRTVVLAEFLHSDDGPVIRGAAPPPLDQVPRPTCVFGFARTSNLAHVHYLLGVEPSESDKRGIKRPEIKLAAGGPPPRRWAWRSRR